MGKIDTKDTKSFKVTILLNKCRKCGFIAGKGKRWLHVHENHDSTLEFAKFDLKEWFENSGEKVVRKRKKTRKEIIEENKQYRQLRKELDKWYKKMISSGKPYLCCYKCDDFVAMEFVEKRTYLRMNTNKTEEEVRKVYRCLTCGTLRVEGLRYVPETNVLDLRKVK